MDKKRTRKSKPVAAQRRPSRAAVKPPERVPDAPVAPSPATTAAAGSIKGRSAASPGTGAPPASPGAKGAPKVRSGNGAPKAPAGSKSSKAPGTAGKPAAPGPPSKPAARTKQVPRKKEATKVMTEQKVPSPVPVPEPATSASGPEVVDAGGTEAEEVAGFDGHAKVDRPSQDPLPPPPHDPDVPETPFEKVLKELPFLSDYYDETYVYLVPCDPESIYCVFEVGDAARAGSEGTLRRRLSSRRTRSSFASTT